MSGKTAKLNRKKEEKEPTLVENINAHLTKESKDLSTKDKLNFLMVNQDVNKKNIQELLKMIKIIGNKLFEQEKEKDKKKSTIIGA